MWMVLVVLWTILMPIAVLLLIIYSMVLVQIVVNRHRIKIRRKRIEYYMWLSKLGLYETARFASNKKVKEDMNLFGWFY